MTINKWALDSQIYHNNQNMANRQLIQLDSNDDVIVINNDSEEVRNAFRAKDEKSYNINFTLDRKSIMSSNILSKLEANLDVQNYFNQQLNQQKLEENQLELLKKQASIDTQIFLNEKFREAIESKRFDDAKLIAEHLKSYKLDGAPDEVVNVAAASATAIKPGAQPAPKPIEQAVAEDDFFKHVVSDKELKASRVFKVIFKKGFNSENQCRCGESSDHVHSIARLDSKKTNVRPLVAKYAKVFKTATLKANEVEPFVSKFKLVKC